MKDEKMKGQITSIISTALILVVCLVTCAMYIVTGYYLYYYLAITSLFLGGTSLFFIILEFIDALSKQPKIENVKKVKVKKAKRKKKASEDSEDDAKQEEHTSEDGVEEVHNKKTHKKIAVNYYVIAKVISVIIYIVVFYYSNKTIWNYTKTLQVTQAPAIVNAVFLLILFVILIVLDRLCKYAEPENSFSDALLQNSRIFFKLLCFETLVAVACIIVESMNLLRIQKYVGFLYAGLFYYYVVFVTISLMVIAIRKEFCVAPYLNVPIPMWKTKGSQDRMGFIEYLETNTGISMRSLISVKYVKQILPLVVLVSATVLWISTCIVQVETYQQAAVYRLGTLQEKILKPGIHLTLPYPFDKVEIYDTEIVNKTTIGYRAEENTDNIWTEAHGGEEFKLLLGGGDELVSINLRLEYKISDLQAYLRTTTDPKAHMEALAYELVTDQTIATDLSSLLSADRDAFAANFRKELTGMLKERNIGLEVVSVVLESIHPPVEIATVYQELISAEITAEKYILYAQGNANTSIANAEATYDTTVNAAKASYSEKVAAAKSSVAQFTASVEAYKTNKDAYTYYKYLSAIREAYGNANLVILGEGVDESRLYFGTFSGGSSSGSSSSGSSSSGSSSSGNSSSSSSSGSTTTQ